MYAGKVTFLTALSALHGDSFHVARFVHKCGNWVKGGEARAGGWGPWRSNFPQISNKICNYSECVISPGAKHKLSTKLHTIWSHVLDRSAKVLNKLIIPLSQYCTHSFNIDDGALAKYNVQLSVSY